MEFDCLRPKPQYQFHDYYKTELDDLIYCELCDNHVFEYCAIHGPLLAIPDEVPSCITSRLPLAALTLPGRFLHIAPTSMPGGGLGVFASRDIPSRVRFGPYGGIKTTAAYTSAYFTWQVVDSDLNPIYTIDASDPNRSNWMRYVNCARRQYEQNLVAYQFRGQMYYRTIKAVRRDTELLVFFGSEAAHSIGVHLGYYCWPKTEITESLENPPQHLEKAAVQSDAKLIKNDYSKTENSQNIIGKNINLPTVDTTHSINSETTKQSVNSSLNVNQNQLEEFQCEYCKKVFLTKSLLDVHLKKHTRPPGKNKCDQCEYRATQLGNLKRHIRTHTGEKPHKCDQCEYMATQLSNLKKHIRTHTGEKPYKCDQCEYRSTQLGDLKRHIRTHTGEKPYKCDQCEYRSTQLGDLKRHIRTHTGEKPYKCDQCEYRSTQLSNLKKHIRTHTRERPYKCDQCEYRATNLYNLKRHIRTHTGEKPYKCNHCEYRATRLGTLKRHIQKCTGQKP